MKNVLIDILRGVRTGLFYVLCLGMIVCGVWVLCVLHNVITTNAWAVVLIFTLAMGFIIVGGYALWLLGSAEKDMVDKNTLIRDIRQRLWRESIYIKPEDIAENPLDCSNCVVRESDIEKVLLEVERNDGS